MQSGSSILHGSYVNHARNYAFQLGRLLDKNFTSDDSKELLDVLRKASAEDIVAQCNNVSETIQLLGSELLKNELNLNKIYFQI